MVSGFVAFQMTMLLVYAIAIMGLDLLVLAKRRAEGASNTTTPRRGRRWFRELSLLAVTCEGVQLWALISIPI